MKSILLCSCLFLLCQTDARAALQIPFRRNIFFDTSYSSTQKVVEEPDILDAGISEFLNSSAEYRTENGSVQPLLREENSVSTNQNSSESATDGQSSTNSSTTVAQTAAAVVFGNESQSQNSSQLTSTVSYDGASQDTNSSEISINITVSSASNESNEAEQEGVARGKPTTTESSITTPQPQSLYQKTWTMISDTYTLSILVPVAAGVVFATTILITLAFCRCLRRCCVRRRMRKKVLPDSVKNLRPSDRARLLAESSDDEF